MSHMHHLTKFKRRDFHAEKYFVLTYSWYHASRASQRTRDCRTRKNNIATTFFQFIIFYFLLVTSCAYQQLCSYPGPIDLLGNALSNAPTEVEVFENGINGYWFNSTTPTLSVPSESVFTLCNKFPSEFSVILTLKHSSQPNNSTNQFVMTMIEKNTQAIKLSIRIRGDRIFIDFDEDSSAGGRRGVGIRDERIVDGSWHTLVITVAHQYVKFTVDCKVHSKKKFPVPFPRRMNIKNTIIYIGSRGKQRRRYVGLMRQLILFPGVDASQKICPSSNPRFAHLDDNSDVLLTPKPNVLFESDYLNEDMPCTSINHGKFKYTVHETLEICNGKSYKPIRGGRERLDFVIDYEDIRDYTVNEETERTLSIETFQINNVGTFFVTANKNKSRLYLWDGKSIKLYQTFYTREAYEWKAFVIDGQQFLAVANGGTKLDRRVYCKVYIWSPMMKQFNLHQSIRTERAQGLGAFSIGKSNFLFVVNNESVENPGLYEVNSKLYVWRRRRQRFVFVQNIPTVGGRDVAFFTIESFHALVVANSYDGQTTVINSAIYYWVPGDGRFMQYQLIETEGAADWEYFQMTDPAYKTERHFLVVANNQNFQLNPNSGINSENLQPNWVVGSKIYELDPFYKFQPYQEITTYGALDWEYFTIGNQLFIIVANSYAENAFVESPYTSVIYRWQGVEKFVPVHNLPIGRTSNFNYVQFEGEHFLASAYPYDSLSKLYKIITY